jgi:D-glycero-alpha-D-manno-heptose 1-phosphate guanylyltransferase
MEAIILVGGFGTRLRSVVSDAPKPMALINGRPFLEILLIELKNKGFRKVILCVGYLKEKIIDYFSRSSIGIEIVYSVESEPLGTGGAVKNAIHLVSTDYVFVLNGDTFQEFDPEVLTQQWTTFKSAVLLLRSPTDEERYGSVEVDEETIIKFKTKQVSSDAYINGGVYVLPKTIFDQYELPLRFSLEEFFERNASTLKMRYVIALDNRFIDIGTPLGYARFIEVERIRKNGGVE